MASKLRRSLRREQRGEADHRGDHQRGGDPVAADQVAGEQDRRAEPRRRRPRGAGVGGLVDEVRQPREEQQHRAAETHDRVADEPAAVVAAQPHRDQREDRPGGEEDPPAVGVEHRRQRQREQDQVARRRKTKPWMNAAVARSPSSPISSYIRVSCAYWVRNGLNANSVAAMIPARRPNRLQPAQNADRDRQQPEEQRERVGGGLADAEQLDPEVQQDVEQRRRAVVAEDPGDLLSGCEAIPVVIASSIQNCPCRR